MTERRVIRIELSEEEIRKYKVFCAIENMSMTKQTNILVKEFIKSSEDCVKIIKISNPEI